MYGYTREEVLGQHIDILVPPDRRHELPPIYDQLRRGDRVESFETVQVTKSGRPVWVLLTISPIKGPHGTVIGVSAIAQDISDRKHLQTQLEARVRQQETVATIGKAALDAQNLQPLLEHTVTLVAETLAVDFCKILELLPGDEALVLRAGIGWQEGLIGNATVGAGPASQTGYTLASKTPVIVQDLQTETRFHGPSLLFDHGVVSGISVIVPGQSSRPYGVLAVHTRSPRTFTSEDISFLESVANIVAAAIHRLWQEQQLEDTNTTLEQRIAERTTSLVQHQEHLRRLTSELTLAEQSERRRLASELHDYLAQLLVVCRMKLSAIPKLARSARVLERVRETDELLDQSLKYTRSLISELTPRVLYDAGLVAAIEWLAEHLQRQHGLRIDVQKGIPTIDLGEDQAVLLFQTVRELLLNIVKHAGVHEARVFVGRTPQQELTIIVADSGIGFDPSHGLSYERGEDHFGLLNCRERLLALGGRFDVASSPGSGTRVTLVLPLQTETASQPERSAPMIPESPPCFEEASKPTGALVQVLLADDHELFRQEVRKLLTADPTITIVGEAADGEQAVELCRSLHPDVVLMDIGMKPSGIDATRRIKQSMPATTIIALSVFQETELAVPITEFGAAAHLTKSDSLQDLRSVIRNIHQRSKDNPSLPEEGLKTHGINFKSVN